MTGVLVVHELDAMATAVWSFRDSLPLWRHRNHGATATWDPFPAYRHDMAVVHETVAHVTDRCPPRYDVELFVADREELGRSNGFSHAHLDGGSYVDDRWVEGEPIGLIMLSGKRVPPHPALTRYLVAHEYGHNVEWMLNHARSARHLHDDQLVRDYATYRGLPDATVHHGSGGRRHDSVTEIFACDFRVIVCGVEVDFWPHPGIPHPLDRSLPHDLHSWWADALAELARP